MIRHIVVIDDCTNDLEIVGRVLSWLDWDYHLVNQVEDVIKQITCIPTIDLVLLDLQMPPVSGYDLLPLLRILLSSHIPIVCVSAHTSEIHTAYEMGFNGFISKPIDPDTLPILLDAILEGKQVWDLNYANYQ